MVHASLEEPSQARPAPTRRMVLKTIGAVAGAGAFSTSGSHALATQRQTPRVAIVGAGIAGLNAALTLREAGIPSTVYEASGSIGGRIHSNKTAWLEGQTSEWCGELIDSNHVCMRALARRFGLTLIDEIAAQPVDSIDTLYVLEKYYGIQQAHSDFQKIAAQLAEDARRPLRNNSHLDKISALQWIDKYVPGGHKSPLGAYIESAYTNEGGLDCHEQSALNIVYSMGGQPDPASLSIYGFSDQRYSVLGGNDQIPSAIAAALGPQHINTGWRMVSIRKRSDGTFELIFSIGGALRHVLADHVILTLPFSVLRHLDHHKAGFDDLKRTAIKELGYGTEY